MKYLKKLGGGIFLFCFFVMEVFAQQKENPSHEFEPFTGVIRGRAKTTVSKGKEYHFANVKSFLEWLPTDEHMHDLGIKNNSNRFEEEDCNISIGNASVFGMTLEEDGDVHVVIGDWETEDVANCLITIEISGLPDELYESSNVLKKARSEFYAAFPFFKTMKKATYKSRSKSPVIQVKGSLFFDHYHRPDQGNKHKPQTSFEIHPVTAIKRLDK